MRKLKTILTQDHMIHVVETTESANDSLACGSELILPESLTTFHIRGTENMFTKDNVDDDWTLCGSYEAPGWQFAKANVHLGSITTSPVTTLVFVAQDRAHAQAGPKYAQEADLSNREEIEEIGAYNLIRNSDSTTGEVSELDLDDEVSDEVVFE